MSPMPFCNPAMILANEVFPLPLTPLKSQFSPRFMVQFKLLNDGIADLNSGF
jgi:hypothetical protein